MADFDLAYAIDGDASGAVAAARQATGSIKEVEAAERGASDAANDLAANTNNAAGAMGGAATAATEQAGAMNKAATQTEKARAAAAQLQIAEAKLSAATADLTVKQNAAAKAATIGGDAQAKAAVAVANAEARVIAARERVITGQKRLTDATKESIGTSDKQAFAVRNIGQQIGDFGQQALAGAGVMRSFAQQAGQLGYALSELESGPFAKVGKFLVGPWGIAFTIALQAVAAFSGSLFEAKTAAEQQAEALKTLEGQTRTYAAAIVDLNKTLAQETLTTRSNLAAHFNAAVALRDQEIATRNLTKARLADEIAAQKIQQGAPGQRGELANLPGGGAAGARIGVLQGLIAEQDKAIGTANTNVRLAQLAINQQRVKESTDASAKALGDFNRASARLDAQLARGTITQAEHYRQSLALSKQYAITAASAKGSASAQIEADSSLEAATTAVGRAAARVAQVRAQNAKDLAAHNITQAEATSRLEAAKSALASAREAQVAHNAAVRQGKKEQSEANAELRRLEALLDSITAKYARAADGGKGFAKDLKSVAELTQAGKLNLGDSFELTGAIFDRQREATLKEQEASAAKYFTSNGETPEQQLRGVIDKIDGAFAASGRTFRDEALQAGKDFANAVGTVAGALQQAIGGRAGSTISTLGGILQSRLDPEARQTRAANSAKLQDAITKIGKGIGISDEAATKIGKFGGKAIEGAATGALANSVFAPIAKGLGLKTSQTGAQIGGAIGSFLPIPGGDIIGSIAGSIVGGLFKKTKYGGATIGDTTSDATLSGNSGAAKKTADTLAGAVQSGIEQIAQQLGGTVGTFAPITIGTYKDKFRVQLDGSSHLGGKNRGAADAIDFGKDGQDEAIAFAIKNAVARGAVQGLDAAVQKALQSDSDIDKALAEALNVQKVEALIGGIGYSLEQTFSIFDKTASDQVALAKKYGLDALKAEKTLADQRTKLINDTVRAAVGSLQDLLDQMATGDLFEGSASDKRNSILSKIGDLRPQAEQGVDGAADQLSQLYSQLLANSRDAFGTAGSEYAADRETVKSGAAAVIKAEQDRVAAAAKMQSDTLAAAQANNDLTGETNDLLAINNNLLQKLVDANLANASVGGGQSGVSTGRYTQLF